MTNRNSIEQKAYWKNHPEKYEKMKENQRKRYKEKKKLEDGNSQCQIESHSPI